MCTWHGFPRNKCIRCFKPRAQIATGQSYKTWLAETPTMVCRGKLTTLSSSCGLEFRRTTPEAIAFKPEDITIESSPDEYRGHKLKFRLRETIVGNSHTSEQLSSAKLTRDKSHDTPSPIDLVCRHLTLKW